MRTLAVLTLVAAVTVGRAADEVPKPDGPTKQHEWLKKFVGEWETACEMPAAPGQPAASMKGTETVKAVGGLWVVSELKGDAFGMPFTGQTTIGYDPKGKKYVGTWFCSMDAHLWKYEGTVEGNTLTLLTEGPNHLDPTKMCKMKDVTEFTDADTRVLTSYIQGEDGKWTKFMSMTAKRKK